MEQPGGALSSADAVKYAIALLCVIAVAQVAAGLTVARPAYLEDFLRTGR